MNKIDYTVLTSSFLPFGPKRLSLLISYFKSSEGVWNASASDLLSCGLSSKIVRSFDSYRKAINPQEYFRNLEKEGVYSLTKDGPSYPFNLSGLDDSPLTLFVKGKLKKGDFRAIAIIGSRKMSEYGRKAADYFSRELSKKGITIVSGLARGVDTQAHTAAIMAGGRTIAICACGLDRVYPPENQKLAGKIIKSGALISEYPLGYPPYRENFVVRNRIVAGLSRAVVVIEGEEKSGTLITATYAANQGRTVFAVPGSIFSKTSGACRFLIKNGCEIAFDAGDILESVKF